MFESELERVRVLEPRPDQPAVSMPVFGDLLGTLPLLGSWRVWVFAPAMAAFGTLGYLIGRYNPVDALILVFLAGVWIAFAVWRALRWNGLHGLADTSFTEVTLPPDDLMVHRDKVFFRFSNGADAQWTKVRLPWAASLQLAARRRLWLLGPDAKGRRFVQLPGVLWPYRTQVVPAPPSEATRPETVGTRIVPAAEDPVLLAHRSRLLRLICVLVAGMTAYAVVMVIVVPLVVVFMIGEDSDPKLPGWTAMPAGCLAIVVITYAGRLFHPLPRADWVELVAVPQGTVVLGTLGLATLGCRLELPGGQSATGVLSTANPALAANVWAAHRVWVIGQPVRGKTVFVGVPGHAVFGKMKIK